MEITPNDNTAQIIFKQLYTMDANLMACLGARQFIAHPDGLRFRVSGVKFKGLVFIRYNEGQDLYEVELAKIYKSEWKVKKSWDGIYFDMLPELLERHCY